jgi:hypothetical protein
VLNDFRDSFSFIDYKVYGTLEIFDACIISGEEWNESGDIGVFLNFELVGRFKAKSEAVSMLNKLISEAPKDAKRFFEDNQEVLLKNLLC